MMKKLFSALVISCFLATSVGCGAFKAKAKDAEKTAVDCAKADLGINVPGGVFSLLMTVVGILYEGGMDWKADIAKLESSFGPGLIHCAVVAAEQMFRPAPSLVPVTGDQVESPHDRALQALGLK